MTRSALFALCVFLAAPASPQIHHHANDESAVVRELPPARKLSGIGISHLTITTTSPEAQEWFDQGLSLLHCFWDFEAYRAFREANRLDPACAMCQWGIHRALGFFGEIHKEERKAAIDKAKELMPKVSEHEQLYLRAEIAADDKKADDARHEMETLVDRYPGDVEARLFLALDAMGGYDSKGAPRTGELYSQELLKDLLRTHPEHPAVHHYWIHAMEGSSRPEAALDSAEKLGRMTPASGHMVHMPGHIFYRVGDYERARQSFLDAMHVDEAYMQSQNISAHDDWNYAHNLSYLIADCAEAGRYQEGVEYSGKLLHAAEDPNRVKFPETYALRVGGSLARLHIRFGKWREVINNPINFEIADDKLSEGAKAYRDGLISYARGMQAVELGRLDDAERQSEALDARLWRLSQQAGQDKAEDKVKQVLKVLGVASLDLRGNVASGRDRHEEAYTLLKAAVEQEKDLGYAEPPLYSRPALESLGFAYLRAGKWQEGREAFDRVLIERPKSGFAYYGIAESYERAGNKQKAREAWAQFLQAWPHADRDLSQMRRARE